MIALAALLLLGAACGSDGGAGGPYGGDGASPTTGGGAAGGGEDDGGSGSAAVTVQVNNFLFAPSDIEVAAGSEIEVRNGNANTPHTFTVEGTDIDLELSPMGSEDVTIDLDPGGYDVICRFHGQMTATLTVT
jgi:plastocyanin